MHGKRTILNQGHRLPLPRLEHKIFKNDANHVLSWWKINVVNDFSKMQNCPK